jgi:Cadherin domain
MTIYAIDGGEPSRTGSTLVEVTVLDANDNSPVFDRDSYEVRVPETASVGTVLVTVRATDKDSGLNGAVHYEFSKHSGHDYGMLFVIRPDSGKIVLQQS